MRRFVFVALVVCVLLLFCTGYGELEVHFIDVGQGDAALILCDGESMLIDGGSSESAEKIYSYIRNAVDHLDCIIATHPHKDHIDGIPSVLNAVPVDMILSPVKEWDSKSFKSIIKYANAQGTQIVVPNEGDTIKIGGSTVEIVHCWPEAWLENDMSIVCRLDYGSTSILFMGDAEEMSEYMIMDSSYNISSDVIKIAHHGSKYSSTKSFIKAVNPQYAVISCGAGNEYAHPHQEVLDRLGGVTVLRTDLNGTIIVKSDGKEISVATEKTATPESLLKAPAVIKRSVSVERMYEIRQYVLNCKTMKIHLPECDSVKEISPQNRMYYMGTLVELINNGYDLCKKCFR